MVLNTCPGGAAVESPELPPHHHHPLRASDVCICGETNIYCTLKISFCTKPQWVSLQTTALQTQHKLMLDLPAEECAVHNEFWYGAYDCKTHWQNLTRLRLRNQMFSCSWCWSWFASVVGNRTTSPAQSPRVNKTIQNEISEICRLDLPMIIARL